MSQQRCYTSIAKYVNSFSCCFFTNLAACARRFFELGALGSAIIVLVDMSSLLEVIDTLRSPDTIVC